MRRHEEDKLIELAFGDLSPTEAEALRAGAEADPRKAQALQLYSEMRKGLTALRDVPEMQLSCDRLRDAILAGGLKESRRSSWGWFAVPAVVVAGAFFLTLSLQQRNSGTLPLTGVATLSDAEVSLFDTTLGRTTLKSDRAVFDSALTEYDFGPSASTDVKAVAVERKVSRPVRSTGVEPSAIASAPTPGSERMSSSAEMAPVSFGTSEPPRDEIAAETRNEVILIESEQSFSGAQRATEMESLSNVVIGG